MGEKEMRNGKNENGRKRNGRKNQKWEWEIRRNEKWKKKKIKEKNVIGREKIEENKKLKSLNVDKTKGKQ